MKMLQREHLCWDRRVAQGHQGGREVVTEAGSRPSEAGLWRVATPWSSLINQLLDSL